MWLFNILVALGLSFVATTFFWAGLGIINAKGRFPVGVFPTEYRGESRGKYDPQQVVIGILGILFALFLYAVSVQIILDALAMLIS